MSNGSSNLLGIMRPLGGGDPIPLKKEEMTVGRRATCDIQLDFENVSGKHCVLKLVKGVWHVRDLNSTNGTLVNGQRIQNEHGLMPDDELAIATHPFMIDYDPVAPTSLMSANQVLEEEIAETTRKHPSLMELAGLETEERSRRRARPERAPSEPAPRPRASEVEFEDEIPTALDPVNKVNASDDDFFRMIQGDLGPDDSGPKNKKR